MRSSGSPSRYGGEVAKQALNEAVTQLYKLCSAFERADSSETRLKGEQSKQTEISTLSAATDMISGLAKRSFDK